MILKNFKYLDTEYKGKFIKMCLLLFPQYKSATITDKGMVVFRSRFSLFARVKIPFFNLIAHDIIMKLSILRWNSRELATRGYFKSLLDLQKNYNRILVPTISEQIKFVKEVIDFLYSEFQTTNLKNIYGYYALTCTSEDKLMELPSEDPFIKVVKDNVSRFHQALTLENTSHTFKRCSALISVAIMIVVASVMFFLSNIPAKVTSICNYNSVISEFPWRIVANT